MFGLDIGALITLLAPFIIKLLEYLLDRSKLTREQSKALIELIRQSQKQPVSSVEIKRILQSATDDILEHEKEINKSRGSQ